MGYICQIGVCNETWDTAASVGQHRRKCKKYNASHLVVPNASARFAKNQSRKRRKLMEASSSKQLELEASHDDIDMLHVEAQGPSPTPVELDAPMDAPMDVQIPEPQPPEPELLGRSHRKKIPTYKARQLLPDPAPPPIVPSPAATAPPEQSTTNDKRAPTFVWQAIKTLRNSFGLYREYPCVPSHNPDDFVTLDDIYDVQPPRPLQPNGETSINTATAPPTNAKNIPQSLVHSSQSGCSFLPATSTVSNQSPANPVLNGISSTASGLLKWMWSGSPLKSLTEVEKLMSFLKSDAFQKEDLMDFDLRKETSKLDSQLHRVDLPTPDVAPITFPSPPAQKSKSTGRRPSTHPSATSSQGANATTSATTAPVKQTKGSKTDTPRPSLANRSPDTPPQDGWRIFSVDIAVPDGTAHETAAEVPLYKVPNLHIRSLVEIIRSAFSEPASRAFHYTPFKKFWVPSSNPEAPPERVFDEIYTSDAMINEHAKIHELPAEKFQGKELERVVAAIMFWSDSTHLTNFGTESLWPVYLYFGNQSKYARAQPEQASCHHVAYLPEDFKDFYRTKAGKAADSDILSHCRRELMHQIWKYLLDDDFLHAYEHGIVIKCPDGEYRRFYPRIFTYSADYPEKALLATTRSNGTLPCPRCMVPKNQIFEMGTKYDQGRRTKLQRKSQPEQSFVQSARNSIYKFGRAIRSKFVEDILGAKSLVPTLNSFSVLAKHAFDIHKALVVDFMHEVELGTWKALFTHLIRILYSIGTMTVQELNERYRLVPTFGLSTIRLFSNDAAGMKKMAARNFEDLLLCAIPVFEGLLGAPYDSEVTSLLFTMAEWHTLAKLRLHTSATLLLLRDCTSQLGKLLRRFRSFTCSHFLTKELPSESQKRAHDTARKNAKTPGGETNSRTKKDNDKIFSLSTYKLHALGDYASTIECFGTTDSYSTQAGELEHKRVKRFYARTNKKDPLEQITKLERRENHYKNEPPLPTQTVCLGKRKRKSSRTPPVHGPVEDYRPSLPCDHAVISTSKKTPVDITRFLSDNHDDPALKDFIPKLKRHVLWRILNPGYTCSDNNLADVLSPQQTDEVFISGNRLFMHQTMRINYTSYDLRRDQDSINPSNHADVVCLSRRDDGDHPYEYARVLLIFHVVIFHQVPGGAAFPQTFNVLFVRRYGVDSSYRAGFKRKRLHRIQFLPQSDVQAFDFLDPDNVIRAAHLIPAFHHKATKDLLVGKSIARKPGETDDWLFFYVNMFVDRDMYMRYRGGGIGHYQVVLPSEEGEFEFPSEDTNELGKVIDVDIQDDEEEDENDGDTLDEQDEEEEEESGNEANDGGDRNQDEEESPHMDS